MGAAISVNPRFSWRCQDDTDASFLDEVHKYPTWSKEVKEIIDLWPDLRITFTGSSLLQILNADADLSRRVLNYDMTGLSFRDGIVCRAVSWRGCNGI